MRFLEIRRSTELVLIFALFAACTKSEASVQTNPKVVPAGACGDRELPDCPTQGWMKANLQLSLISNDLPRLAKSFDQLAAAAPAAYDDWAAIARKGAAAARAADIAGAKAACTACHDRHRARFKLELRYQTIL